MVSASREFLKTSSRMSRRRNSKVDCLKDYMMIMLCRTFLVMIGVLFYAGSSSLEMEL